MINSILIFAFCIAFTFQLNSQYKVEWAAKFSSSGNLSVDKALFIDCDKDGSVIVCGVTNGSGINNDITTIKYDRDGKQLWAAVYNGTGNYHDKPNGFALDQSGGIYVTGSSSGDNGTSSNFITLKYSPNGMEEWTAIQLSKGGLTDESRSIAVDNTGNVYVTGLGTHIQTENSGQDWITIKYNSSGKQLWKEVLDNGISSDRASVLTTDESGNIYVSGQCNGPAYHIKTIKYNPSGEKVWVAKYDGAGISSDEPADIKVDLEGNVFLTGNSFEANRDFITIKYDRNGNEVWKRIYNGTGNSSDESVKLLIDNSGNVYILGLTTLKKNKKNRCLIKYDNSGNESWKVISEEPVSSYIENLTMEFGQSGNILVTGSGNIISNKTITYMVIDSFDKDGNLQWHTNYSHENSIPVINAISSDDSGNIYAAGYEIGRNGIHDYCVVKFSK